MTVFITEVQVKSYRGHKTESLMMVEQKEKPTQTGQFSALNKAERIYLSVDNGKISSFDLKLGGDQELELGSFWNVYT